jgi:hypothetical protein
MQAAEAATAPVPYATASLARQEIKRAFEEFRREPTPSDELLLLRLLLWASHIWITLRRSRVDAYRTAPRSSSESKLRSLCDKKSPFREPLHKRS